MGYCAQNGVQLCFFSKFFCKSGCVFLFNNIFGIIYIPAFHSHWLCGTNASGDPEKNLPVNEICVDNFLELYFIVR